MVSVVDRSLPLALARRHWAMAVGEVLDLPLSGSPPDAARLHDVLTGAGFDVASIAQDGLATLRAVATRARTLPDTVGPGMRALACGLNPSVVAADAGYGYAGRSNRFWPAAMAASLVTQPRDPLHALLHDGVGMTDLVKRATPTASLLDASEYRAGVPRVLRLVEWLRPAVVVFVGLTGWRLAVDQTGSPGWQPAGFGGRPAYLMPSTSGLNARTSLTQLVEHLEEALGSPGSTRTGPRHNLA